MSRRPRKILNLDGVKVDAVDAAVLLAVSAFGVDSYGPSLGLVRLAQRYVASWIGPAVYFVQHFCRPDRGGCLDAIARLRFESLLIDVAGPSGIGSAVSFEGRSLADRVAAAMPGALSSRGWIEAARRFRLLSDTPIA